MRTYDKLWKGIIEDLFEDFLHFFYPNAAELFDFSKGFEFLDKELLQLFPESESQEHRYVDKLVKVWLKNGTSHWILVHCEVQGYADNQFGERMFVYFYRILDRYQVKIASLAILSDAHVSFHPKKYESDFLETKLSFEFKTYKILEQDIKTLEESNNPFATVILTALQALKNKTKGDESIMNAKLDLMRRLRNRAFSSEKIRAIFSFINMYIRFENSENNAKFEVELDKVYPPKNRNMGVIDIIIEDVRQESLAKGIEIEKIEVIRSAREEGMSTEVIAKIVKLTPERVREILTSIGLK